MKSVKIETVIFSMLLLHIKCDLSPKLTLNNGYSIPLLGLGTWMTHGSETYQTVKDAIDIGYTHFDTAYLYNNEEEVGRAIGDAIKAGKVKREDLFITSKVLNNQYMFSLTKGVKEGIQESLTKLNLKYLDLMLIHFPYGGVIFKNDYLTTWKILEDAVRAGKIRSIGLSNFNENQIERVLNNCRIKPAVLQIESHPHLTNDQLIEFCKDNNIAVTAYSPFKHGRLLNDRRLIAIGNNHGKSAAQVMLRFQVQRDVIVIPKTTKKKWLIENSKIFDFKLTDEEMNEIESMNQNSRVLMVWDIAK